MCVGSIRMLCLSCKGLQHLDFGSLGGRGPGLFPSVLERQVYMLNIRGKSGIMALIPNFRGLSLECNVNCGLFSGMWLLFVQSLQSCLDSYDSVNGSPPGCFVHGISGQDYWGGLPFLLHGSSHPGIDPTSPCFSQVHSLPLSHQVMLR